MSIRNFSSTASPTTLTAGLSTAAVGATDTLHVVSNNGYPAAPFLLAVDRGIVGSQEVMEVTAYTPGGTTFTVTRAYDSAGLSTAPTHAIGATVEHVTAAIDVREPNAFINLITTRGDSIVGGATVGTSGTPAKRVPIGTAGQVWVTDGTDAFWGADSVAAGLVSTETARAEAAEAAINPFVALAHGSLVTGSASGALKTQFGDDPVTFSNGYGTLTFPSAFSSGLGTVVGIAAAAAPQVRSLTIISGTLTNALFFMNYIDSSGAFHAMTGTVSVSWFAFGW